MGRGEEWGEVRVGYVDGKEEVITIKSSDSGSATPGKTTTGNAEKGKVYPRKQRKEEEAISLLKLVDRVDGWARTLKLKDEGSA